VNFAQVKILGKLAGDECNVFAVGDPDQAIYRFRGASSAAFGLFLEHFPEAKMIVLGNNRRSTSTILNSAFALISRNPDVFPRGQGLASTYQRSPLISAREEEAYREGKPLPNPPVDAVVLAAKESECSDLVASIRDRQRKLRCKWSDFAILYRQHFHRELIVAELVEQGIPFAIENMDVVDTPEARDLFACLGAVVSLSDSASLFRVASFPQFAIDPQQLRAGIKAIPREERKSGVASVLAKMENGAAVLSSLQQVRNELTRGAATSSGVLNLIIRQFELNRASPAIAAVLDFVKRWEEKPKAITKTGDIAEFNARQAVVQRRRIYSSTVRPENAELRLDVRTIGEEVRRPAVRPVPVRVEDVSELFVPQRVSGLQRILIGGCLSAQLRKQVHVIGSRVAPVEVGIYALPQALVLLRAPSAASATATAAAATQTKRRSICPDAAHITNPYLCGVRLRRRKQVIVLDRIRNIRFRKILEQRPGLL